MGKRKANGKGTLFLIGSVYYVQFYSWKDGKRIRKKKTLKTGDEREAQKRAKEVIKKDQSISTEDDVVEKLAIAKGVISPEKILAIKNAVTKTQERKVRFSESWALFEKAQKKKNIKEITLVESKRYWERLVNWCYEKLGEDSCLHSLSIDDAKEFEEKLSQDTNMGGATFNKYIRFCKSFYRLLSYEAGITVNPFDFVELMTISAKQKEALTPEQVYRMFESIEQLKEAELTCLTKSLAQLNYKYKGEMSLTEELNDKSKFEKHIIDKWSEYKALFTIGIYTGLRLMDACNLKWSQVNLDKWIISLPPAKSITGSKIKWVELPIVKQWFKSSKCVPSFTEILEEMKCKMSNDYVLPLISKLYQKHRCTPQKKASQVFRQGDIKLRLSGVFATFHCLRYTFLSECANNSVPLAIAQDLASHSTIEMTQYYTTIDIEVKRKALEGGQDNEILRLAKSLNKKNVLKVKKELIQILGG
jgi:integrase